MATLRFTSFFFCISIFVLTNVKCGKSAPEESPVSDSSCYYNGVDTCSHGTERLSLTINLADSHQSIHSFGASDAWTTKFIGDWVNVEKKNNIADLLFSLDTLADGSPKGIGLSLWRFNIGAGSFEQGDASEIETDWRREECFLNADGTYDWSKESGNQWFLQAARQRGVKYILGFSNSAPVFMTKNHRAFSPGGDNFNIQPGEEDDYAGFLVKVADHFHFDYISPVNEPQWDWAAGGNGLAGQEGSPATDEDIAAIAKQLSEKLEQQNSNAKVVIGEAGEWDFLYGRNTDGRGDQIAQFFSPTSSNYVGNLADVEPVISAHSYFTTCPDNALVSTRNSVSEKIQQVDPALQTWMTEFGVLGDICSQFNGYPRHTGIDYGLYVAKVLYADLAIANVSSWQWWLAVNPYDYSDGLVYINDPSGQIDVDNCKSDGIVVPSKQLWAFGNYARFIRPGMKRVSASFPGSTDPMKTTSSVMVSAYKDVNTKKLVVVLVNVTNDGKLVHFDESNGFKMKNDRVNTYTTNRDENLKRSYSATGMIVIPPKSIVTLVGSYQ